MFRALRSLAVFWLLTTTSACSLIPQVAHQPSVHNPFPQLSRVAIAPFINLSAEPTVDGRQFALAYFNELQLVPGFVVVPVGTVETTMEAYKLSLDSPEQVRRLAQILGVDAVVVGAVTDYSPFYPPRVAMQVDWYAANPCFHPIPAGYGLPWGTREEEYIPAPLVMEAEMALARAQMKTQAPDYRAAPVPPPPPRPPGPMPAPDSPATPLPEGELSSSESRRRKPASAVADKLAQTATAEQAPSAAKSSTGTASGAQQSVSKSGARNAAAIISDDKVVPAIATTAVDGAIGPELPENWPDPRGFIPDPPCAHPHECIPCNEPVLQHTRMYNGHDGAVTEALASYYFFQDDARFGGWQSYLQRSDDFIRFCCHMHIYEMLSARGGAGESRVVWRWRTDR